MSTKNRQKKQMRDDNEAEPVEETAADIPVP